MQAKPDSFIAPPCHDRINILYEDVDLLLINKPSGLLSLSGKNPLNKDSVHFRIIQDFPTATLVHRLDFGTSGIMIVALNKSINTHLMKQFQNRSIDKSYTAILQDHLISTEGLIEFPIAKDKANFPSQKICFSTGKQAVSKFKVLNYLSNPNRTLVQFTPLTGRTHQLRIHSREIGHPILGCDLYGTTFSQSLADRLQLHATSIHFDHPTTGKRILGVSPCPF